eukprot:5111476-Alexandrium_andersonii.AAC.1
MFTGAVHEAAASPLADDVATAARSSDQPGHDCLIADLQEVASQPAQEAIHVLGTDVGPAAAQATLHAAQLNAVDGWLTLASFAMAGSEGALDHPALLAAAVRAWGTR